jgi:acyl carrier protein
VFVELGVGGALTGLVQSAFPLAVGLKALDGQDDATSLAATASYVFGRGGSTTGRPSVSVGTTAETASPDVVDHSAAAASDTGRETAGDNGRGTVLSRLQQLYADALEYPIQVLGEAALLEADLGVDSVRQTELMARARTQFDLPAPAPGFRSTDLDTLGKIADYVAALRPADEPERASR